MDQNPKTLGKQNRREYLKQVGLLGLTVPFDRVDGTDDSVGNVQLGNCPRFLADIEIRNDSVNIEKLTIDVINLNSESKIYTNSVKIRPDELLEFNEVFANRAEHRIIVVSETHGRVSQDATVAAWNPQTHGMVVRIENGVRVATEHVDLGPDYNVRCG